MRLVIPIFCCFTIAASFACDKRTIDDGQDAGPSGPDIISCSDVSECPDETYDCVGVCLKRCAADEACDVISPSYYCSDQGYCELGCRDASGCEDPETEVCIMGACRARSGGGSCESKCECAPGEVCNGGVCGQPPATCQSADDCGRGSADRCEANLCNGFTQQCFDPDPEPCANNEDCDFRPGCQDGCVCTASSQCVPQGDCTVASENIDCGPGFFCNDQLVCDILPACTDDTQCEALNLECNVGLGECQRPLPCNDDTECFAPTSFCDPSTTPSFCAVPTCLNAGLTCTPEQECAVDGRCVTAGTGGPCNGHTECEADQFCSFATGTGACTPGCRSNASCPTGQECNGANQCAQLGGGGNGQAGTNCTSDADCINGLICGLFLSVCTETCSSDEVGPCNGDCCPLTGAASCEPHPLGLVGFCSYD